jgi:phosphopantothenoylcysteine decarboxylase/phosphopantothenate--cysteine ligase
MAYGVADNLLTSIYLALNKTKSIIIFPAMNTNMLDAEQTKKNIMELALRPMHRVVPPDEGLLACGDVGRGKLPSVDKMVEEIEGHFPFISTYHK